MIFEFIIPIIIIAITIVIIKFVKKKEYLVKILNNKKYIIGFLIVLTIYGFYSYDDFTESCGCLIHSRDKYSIDYIVFSAISLIIFVFCLFLRRTKIILVFIVLETLYWLLKLFILKSGYVGGLGVPIFKIYDYIGLLFRLWFIKLLIQKKINILFIPVLAGLIIGIKFIYFPCQKNLVYEKLIEPKLIAKFSNQISGKWEGTVQFQKRLTHKTIYNTVYYGDSNQIGLIPKSILDTDYVYIGIRDTTFRLWDEKDSLISDSNTNISFKLNDSVLTINKFCKKYEREYRKTWNDVENKQVSFLAADFNTKKNEFSHKYLLQKRENELSFQYIEIQPEYIILIMNDIYLIKIRKCR